jgi:hypothetical protein
MIIQSINWMVRWYRLDRFLIHQAGVDPGIVSCGLTPALRELERAGFITASLGPAQAQTLYSMTQSGVERL